MPALFTSNKKGFTLLEVTTGTFLLTIGVLGVFALIQMIAAFTSSVSSQLTAVYLAQEAIENVRNIRDSNWLEQRYEITVPWDEGISTGNWETIGKFQRKITVIKPQVDKLVVSVQVQWSEKGGSREVRAETELYNWR